MASSLSYDIPKVKILLFTKMGLQSKIYMKIIYIIPASITANSGVEQLVLIKKKNKSNANL